MKSNDNEKNKISPSTLYLVGTPIGNLSDISERAKKTLRDVDFIAAEDTRCAMKLLTNLNIKNNTVSYYEHNKKVSGQRIVERLLGGESCALITDAGMPAISDPGEDLVALCQENGITVSVIPGPCAAISALALSAISSARFAFEGFLPAQKNERRKRLEGLIYEERTMIFYEAPHKLVSTLTDMCDILGEERRISLCRELTKLNEEIIRTTISKALEIYSDKEPKGEYVLVLEGGKEKRSASEDLLTLTVEEHIQYYIDLGESKMDAIKKVAKDRGVHKSEIYKHTI